MPTYAAAVERNKELLCTNCSHSFKVSFEARAGVDSGFFHDVASGFKDDPASRLSRHIMTDKDHISRLRDSIKKPLMESTTLKTGNGNNHARNTEVCEEWAIQTVVEWDG